jgi:hypothetical protein
VDRALKGQPVIVVRSGRNPHSVCLTLGLVLISLYGIFFSTPSVSIHHGLAVERAGQVLLMTGAAVYVIVLCQVSTFARSGLVTTVAAAIALGSAWRIWQITKDVRLLREVGR